MKVNSDQIRKADIVVFEVHDIIPYDGEVLEGLAFVDESAISSELPSVIRCLLPDH
ncbi:MAG: P-type ATPase [Arsenophonus sp. NEOnobi-MAG3]